MSYSGNAISHFLNFSKAAAIFIIPFVTKAPSEPRATKVKPVSRVLSIWSMLGQEDACRLSRLSSAFHHLCVCFLLKRVVELSGVSQANA